MLFEDAPTSLTTGKRDAGRPSAMVSIALCKVALSATGTCATHPPGIRLLSYFWPLLFQLTFSIFVKLGSQVNCMMVRSMQLEPTFSASRQVTNAPAIQHLRLEITYNYQQFKSKTVVESVYLLYSGSRPSKVAQSCLNLYDFADSCYVV